MSFHFMLVYAVHRLVIILAITSIHMFCYADNFSIVICSESFQIIIIIEYIGLTSENWYI